MRPISSMCFLACNRLSNDDVGVARGTVFQERRSGVGFETGDFVKEKLGGTYRRTTLKLWGHPTAGCALSGPSGSDRSISPKRGTTGWSDTFRSAILF